MSEVVEIPNVEFTLEELSKYDGSNSDKKIYIGVKGVVFDVSLKPEFYGNGASYHVFAGKEATRGLAKSSVDPESLKPYGKYDDLNEKDTKTLTDWDALYRKKYPIVGKVKF
eukprot:gene977-9884_t